MITLNLDQYRFSLNQRGNTLRASLIFLSWPTCPQVHSKCSSTCGASTISIFFTSAGAIDTSTTITISRRGQSTASQSTVHAFYSAMTWPQYKDMGSLQQHIWFTFCQRMCWDRFIIDLIIITHLIDLIVNINPENQLSLAHYPKFVLSEGILHFERKACHIDTRMGESCQQHAINHDVFYFILNLEK